MAQNTSKPSAPVYFVTQTNPEIFTATPRPGGVAKIEIPQKLNKLKEKADKVQSSRSRSRVSTPSIQKDSKIKQDTTTSKKSLLTLASTYDEVKYVDVETFPREYKVKQIVAATPWSVEFDEYLESSEDSRRIPDPFQDSVDMLAMSISVIMLLSRGYDKISNTQYKWVISYLGCIRDEFGNIPPNVQGILNHINQLTGGEIKSFLEDDYESSNVEPKNAVQISPSPPTISPPPPPPEE
ncbi:hypothetical protein ABEB36_008248 [Hypothenemus hampei]|uniref:Uncharacterized protein n=1 Tax=Hypothenemus hampei TaxID=57062 RepID=A0ABD1EL84_HYPHA